MAHLQLDHKEVARKFYNQAEAWFVANSMAVTDEVRRFRTEAREMLKIEDTADDKNKSLPD